MNQYLSLKDHVYNFISSKITDGTLCPNEKINEQIICEELNISRTPVREALIQLATEGYLANIPRKGFRVKPIDEKKATELYLVIGSLEGLAAILSYDFITEDHLKSMRNLAIEMDTFIDNEDYESYYKTQSIFHDTYINQCDNDELIRLLDQLKRSFIRQSYVTNNNEDLKEILYATNREHLEIVELFRLGDKIKLESYLRNVHWASSNARFDSF